jgi:hypothetical protein
LVGFLVARAARLELDFVPPEKLADAIGMGVLDAVTIAKELVGLADGGDLSPLHGLLEVLKRLGRDQFLATTLMYPAL